MLILAFEGVKNRPVLDCRCSLQPDINMTFILEGHFSSVWRLHSHGLLRHKALYMGDLEISELSPGLIMTLLSPKLMEIVILESV